MLALNWGTKGVSSQLVEHGGPEMRLRIHIVWG